MDCSGEVDRNGVEIGCVEGGTKIVEDGEIMAGGQGVNDVVVGPDKRLQAADVWIWAWGCPPRL